MPAPVPTLPLLFILSAFWKYFFFLDQKSATFSFERITWYHFHQTESLSEPQSLW